MQIITIQELLFNRGLDKSKKIKLVRHKDINQDLYSLYRYKIKDFLSYQSDQSKDVFKGVDFIVSFIGEEGTLSRFIGVYKILNRKITKSKRFWYDMEEVLGFEALKDKVIIDWGAAAIMWHQWIENQKEVVKIHPGLHYQQFTDYFDVILDFKELQEIVTKQYSDWKRMLSATKGVYLISDTFTGKLYVGSAYGIEGIWGRWSEYVLTKGHGKNKTLKELIAKNPEYAHNFQFSILMVLSRTTTKEEAINKEKYFKRKLGTNSFGLNNN